MQSLRSPRLLYPKVLGPSYQVAQHFGSSRCLQHFVPRFLRLFAPSPRRKSQYNPLPSGVFVEEMIILFFSFFSPFSRLATRRPFFPACWLSRGGGSLFFGDGLRATITCSERWLEPCPASLFVCMSLSGFCLFPVAQTGPGRCGPSCFPCCCWRPCFSLWSEPSSRLRQCLRQRVRSTLHCRNWLSGRAHKFKKPKLFLYVTLEFV